LLKRAASVLPVLLLKSAHAASARRYNGGGTRPEHPILPVFFVFFAPLRDIVFFQQFTASSTKAHKPLRRGDRTEEKLDIPGAEASLLCASFSDTLPRLTQSPGRVAAK
jgi:hypothetical protein